MIRIAWRILTHESGTSGLAAGGIFISVLMVFLQLGFFASVPSGALVIYDHMNFDIMLTSGAYVFQGQSNSFPRRRLYQALAHPDVASASPVYQAFVQWSNEQGDDRHDIFVIGFRLEDPVFNASDLTRQIDILRRPDTILVDNRTHPLFGDIQADRVTELGDRTVTIGGTYTLGIGFLGLGVVMASDQNFLRLVPNQPLSAVSLGLVRLKPGADPDKVAAELRTLMPNDTRILSRVAFEDGERSYWLVKTSTGIVFGFGVAVAVIVGIVILYQTLVMQVSRQLSQYATLKAMGYSDGFLAGIVVWIGLLLAGIAFVPACAAAVGIYQIIRDATRLPIYMTEYRLILVFSLNFIICCASALYASRRLRRADPVDLF